MPTDPRDAFDGDLELARMHFKGFAETALEYLTASSLNLMTFHLAVWMDNQHGGRQFSAEYNAARDKERIELARRSKEKVVRFPLRNVQEL